MLPIWQTFLDELSRPPAVREPSGRRWPMLISFTFAVAAGVALIWLTAGLMAVRGYRRRSRPIEGAEVADQIDRLRTELRCRRPIEIRQTDELAEELAEELARNWRAVWPTSAPRRTICRVFAAPARR